MASARKRYGNVWYAKYKDQYGIKQCVKTPATTKAECLRIANELEQEAWRLSKGLEVAPVDSTMTLAQLCRWWLKERCPAPSLSREESRLRVHVLDHKFGELRLPQVTRIAINDRFREMEKAGAAPASINKVRAMLSTAFENAREAGTWKGTNPIADVAGRKVQKRIYEVLRADEAPLMLKEAGDQWVDLFATAFYMGLRKGELFALKKVDVRLVERELHVRRSHGRDTTKSGNAAVLPIPTPLIPYLQHALETAPGDLVFPNGDGKRRSEKLGMEKTLRRILVRAGLVVGHRHVCRSCVARKESVVLETPDGALRRCPKCSSKMWPSGIPRPMRFHDLRHTTATLLLKARVPMQIVQKILRHANIRLTIDTYGHLDVEDMREAIELMPSASPKPPPGPPSGPKGTRRGKAANSENPPRGTIGGLRLLPRSNEAGPSAVTSENPASNLERNTGFEPATFALARRRSTS